MASGGTTISHGGGLADRYAAALYDLADEQGSLDQTVNQASELSPPHRRECRFPPSAELAR